MNLKVQNHSQKKCHLPYGVGLLDIVFSEAQGSVDIFLPQNRLQKVIDAKSALNRALESPLGIVNPFSGFNPSSKVAIAINDKTRPVPNSVLLPPLLDKLHTFGVLHENITIFIASGTHAPMPYEEFHLVIGHGISRKYRIVAHNCDNNDNLYALGSTFRNTPVFVNSDFYQNDQKIVVGDIEPHHFAGYSGGVKSAAIGLAGRITINANHKLLLDEKSTIGSFDQNPLRQDIEEIGSMMKIDLALNAVLNEQREILGTFFGKPAEVMKAGIRLVNNISRVRLRKRYDVVIASAGGYPKDINLYQAQKAMTHASLFCKPGGSIILLAECVEGIGSKGFLDFMHGLSNLKDVIEKFRASEFSVGPHKAFQIARILQKHQVYLYSSIPSDLVASLLLTPIAQLNEIHNIINEYSDPNVAILPHATACIPIVEEEEND